MGGASTKLTVAQLLAIRRFPPSLPSQIIEEDRERYANDPTSFPVLNDHLFTRLQGGQSTVSLVQWMLPMLSLVPRQTVQLLALEHCQIAVKRTILAMKEAFK